MAETLAASRLDKQGQGRGVLGIIGTGIKMALFAMYDFRIHCSDGKPDIGFFADRTRYIKRASVIVRDAMPGVVCGEKPDRSIPLIFFQVMRCRYGGRNP